MKPLTAVVAQIDSKNAEVLAANLHNHFRSVSVARSLEELRAAIPKHRADVVVVDLEMADLSEIEHLHQEFEGTSIVCTHRLADEEMWTSAISAGASDVCSNADIRGIVLSVLRTVEGETRRAA